MSDQVQRPSGSVRIHDSSVSVWEEPEKVTASYEEKFRREVLAGVVRTLRARGWRVGRDPRIHQHYRCLDKSHRYCTHPSGLQAHLEQAGRTINLELHQAVTKPENRNGSVYDFNKMARMPYLLRLRAIANLVFVSEWLCRTFGYSGPGTSRRELLLGDTCLTNRDRLALQIASWGRPMPGYDQQPRYNRESADKALLSDGARVWFLDAKGRWLTGTAWYPGGNNMWCVLRGTQGGLEHKASHELYLTPPAKPRAKANGELRKERLKKLMLEAADKENFLRAEQLRRVLRGEQAPKPAAGSQLFYIQDTRTVVGNCASWWRPNGHGYTCELSEAGLYTAAQIKDLSDHHKPWPRETVEQLLARHVRVEHLADAGKAVARG